MAREYLFPAVIVLLMIFALPAFAPSARAAQDSPESAGDSENAARPALDPLVGAWECSNGVFTYDYFFQANGTLIQQELTFGNTRNASWTRLSDQEISVAGGPLLTITMDGDRRMSVYDGRVGATWDCNRK